ncbi:hypothetical protein QFC20_006651 [Naganishia adeliensis]|uniref:Uncharacterized protein n=1 Tax=Naganishia adeliensis TaxID=92952 RepID=A0ACC2V8G4_9TREE|nr:hypothetical protein QFC20_006651 [Naganishia adeliensis]
MDLLDFRRIILDYEKGLRWNDALKGQSITKATGALFLRGYALVQGLPKEDFKAQQRLLLSIFPQQDPYHQAKMAQ